MYSILYDTSSRLVNIILILILILIIHPPLAFSRRGTHKDSVQLEKAKTLPFPACDARILCLLHIPKKQQNKDHLRDRQFPPVEFFELLVLHLSTYLETNHEIHKQPMQQLRPLPFYAWGSSSTLQDDMASLARS